MNELLVSQAQLQMSSQISHLSPQQQPQQQQTSTPPQATHIIQPAPGLASTTKKTFGPDGINYDFEPMSREYQNDFPIEDFVLDVASSCNRDAEKAKEWLIKLKTQDIMTVGDLRDLLDDDWAHLNLTVFASRALKNGLNSGARKQHSQVISPRLSVPSSNSSGPLVNGLKSPMSPTEASESQSLQSLQ